MNKTHKEKDIGISLYTIIIIFMMILSFAFTAHYIYKKSFKGQVASEIKSVNKAILLLNADKDEKLSDKDILSMSGFNFKEKENKDGETILLRSEKKGQIKIIREAKGIEIMYELNIYNEFVNFYRNEENSKKYKMKSNCDVIKRSMECDILITML